MLLKRKTPTVLLEFVCLNTSLYLDQFKKTPTVDILMGTNTTFQIIFKIVDLPKLVADKCCDQFY